MLIKRVIIETINNKYELLSTWSVKDEFTLYTDFHVSINDEIMKILFENILTSIKELKIKPSEIKSINFIDKGGE